MSKSRFVYIMQAENKRIKIGISNDVIRRYEAIESSSPLYIYLLHFFETDHAWHIEWRLHALFEDFRHHGEWFDLSDKQIKWLCSLDEDSYDEVVQVSNPHMHKNRLAQGHRWKRSKADDKEPPG